MKINILNEVKNKHKVNSERKDYDFSGTIPDERNKDTCLHCKLKECISNCGLLKGVK